MKKNKNELMQNKEAKTRRVQHNNEFMGDGEEKKKGIPPWFQVLAHEQETWHELSSCRIE
jgi:hypothetical protein